MATKKSKYQGISLLAQLGSAYTYPGSPSNRMLQYGLQNAQAGIQEEILKKQQEKKKSGIGGILGTLGGAALAIPTGGMSIAAGAALGGSLGGAVDSAISGDYAGAAGGLADAAGYWPTKQIPAPYTGTPSSEVEPVPEMNREGMMLYPNSPDKRKPLPAGTYYYAGEGGYNPYQGY